MENTQPQMQGHEDCVDIQNEHNCAGVQRTAFNWFSEDNTTLMQEDTFKGSWKIEVKRKWMWVQTYFGIRAGKGPSTDLLLNLPCNDFFTNCFNCLFPTEISIKKKTTAARNKSLLSICSVLSPSTWTGKIRNSPSLPGEIQARCVMQTTPSAPLPPGCHHLVLQSLFYRNHTSGA